MPVKTTYVYEHQEVDEPEPPQRVLHVPPPPASIAPSHHTVYHAPPPPVSIAPSHHTVMHAPPPPPVMHAPPPPASVHYAQSVRSVSPSRHGHDFYEERIEESNHIGGPLTVLVPGEQRLVRRERDERHERDIKDEIRALEHERRMLKYERDSEYEIVEKREPKREVVRVDKDRKGRLALIRSAH
jgi:hypothetical protein